MTTASATSTTLKDAFLIFRDQCIILQEYYEMYRALLESGDEPKQVMTNTAPAFFQQLNYMLLDHLKLQVARLTDRPDIDGRENLTVNNINEMLSAEGFMTPQISNAADGMMKYRKLILPARHRLISHLDKKTMLNNLTIPGHTKKDIEDFFENLYQYVDSVGIAIGEGPLDFRGAGGPGDVYDLLQNLRLAIKHHRTPASA